MRASSVLKQRTISGLHEGKSLKAKIGDREHWGGKGAERLGLHGDASRKNFIALASNKRRRESKRLETGRRKCF
jgi:hypothetical protein